MKPKLPFTTGPAETPPAPSRRTAPQPLGKASDYGVTDLSNIELEQVKGGWLPIIVGGVLVWLFRRPIAANAPGPYDQCYRCDIYGNYHPID